MNVVKIMQQPNANEIAVIWDKDKLLDYKDSPTDKGENIFIQLWNKKEII